jgi:hypothetical protein
MSFYEVHNMDKSQRRFVRITFCCGWNDFYLVDVSTQFYIYDTVGV